MPNRTEEQNLTKEQKTALDEFRQISDVLVVPTIGKPLPDDRKWTIPRPDEKALEGVFGQAPPPSSESKTGESCVEDSPKQTGRK